MHKSRKVLENHLACGYKKTVAKILAVVLAAGMLCGCHGGGAGTGLGAGTNPGAEGSAAAGARTGEDALSGEGNASSEQDVLNGEEGRGEAAMGRYRETEIALPSEVQEQSLLWFGWGKDDLLELYTARREPSGAVTDTFRYIFRDAVWECDREWAGNALFKEHGLDAEIVIYGGDGRYYLGGTDQDYIYHLLRMHDDGSGEEILPEVFLPEDGRDYGLIPPKIEVLENGNLLIYAHNEVYLYTPEGKRLLAMGKDFSGDSGDARGFSDGEALVTVQGERLVCYDLKTGKMADVAGLEDVAGFKNSLVLFGDGSGGIYAAGETGLAHVNQGGTLWEIMIDGSLNHMGMQSLYLRFFLSGKEQDYYGIFTAGINKGISLFHYVYDPDMPAVPPSSLTVYSLEDNSTIRQAASQFQSEHPEVKVELRTAVEKGEMASEEVVQSLNTELLSGKGADVLILDGLPAQAYVEKGILMDIRDLVDAMEEEGLLLENFMDGFRQEDGAIFQVPSKVAIPMLFGRGEALEAYSSLESMAGYSGEKPLLAAENYENLLRQTAYLHYPELFQEGKITDPDGLVQYLETVKTLGEANGSRREFTSESEMEEKWVSNNVQIDGIMGNSINYDAGRCAVGVERLDGFGDLAVPAQIRAQRPQTQMRTAGKLYLPLSMAGINRSTKHAELAREFIRCLLSYEVQKEELYDGFPVNRKALDAFIQKEVAGYSIGVSYKAWEGEGSDDGYYTIHADWPSRAVREEFGEMMRELTVPILVDETVMKMIVEGSGDYFDDRESAGQAAEKIFRKLSIYLAE